MPYKETRWGGVGDRPYQNTFKRDENGKISNTGTYLTLTLTKFSFKFPDQACFFFGIGVILPTSATEPVGKRIEMFVYAGGNVRAREVYINHMREKCNRVKKLTGKCSPWYFDP